MLDDGCKVLTPGKARGLCSVVTGRDFARCGGEFVVVRCGLKSSFIFRFAKPMCCRYPALFRGHVLFALGCKPEPSFEVVLPEDAELERLDFVDSR